MAQDGHHKPIWLYLMLGGAALVALAMFVLHGAGWLHAILLGAGGLAVVFSASEVMIKAVEGLAERRRMNTFVAGTMAGLSSNVPELVMLGFVLKATPRVGFVVTVLTLHVGAAAFGLYCGVLPRDVEGAASMPQPLVKLSTDLYAAAGGVFFSIGVLMMMMRAFAAPGQGVPALDATDLYVIGGILLAVQTVAIRRLVKRFSSADGDAPVDGDVPAAEDDAAVEEDASKTDKADKTESASGSQMSIAAIVGFGLLGLVASVIGGHAVGDFAGFLVAALTKAGYPEMLGALILSIFSVSGAFVMIGTAHFQKKYDIAMANASGAVTQVPFLVLPVAMILLAVFTQTGLIQPVPGGGVIAIDLHTTSSILLGFPSMLVLWKAVQDDGKVNWVETATMTAIFALVIYLLVGHG